MQAAESRYDTAARISRQVKGVDDKALDATGFQVLRVEASDDSAGGIGKEGRQREGCVAKLQYTARRRHRPRSSGRLPSEVYSKALRVSCPGAGPGDQGPYERLAAMSST